MVPMRAHTRHLSLLQRSHVRVRGLASAPFFGLLLVGLLAGCGGSGGSSSGGGTTAPSSVTQAVGSAGGTVSLPDGSGVTIPSGALKDGSSVTASLISTPSIPLTGSEVADSSVLHIEIPSGAFQNSSSANGLIITLSASSTSSAALAASVAATTSAGDVLKTIRVAVSNGSQTVIGYGKYALNQENKVIAVLTNSYLNLVGIIGGFVGGVVGATDKIVVEAAVTWAPVCFSDPSFGHIYQILGPAPTFQNQVILNPNDARIPLVFVHGWQPTPDRCGEAYKTTWDTYLGLFFSAQDSTLSDKFQPYSFSYDTSKSISGNGQLLANNLANIFGTKQVIVVGHSMGGLVARSALVNYGANIGGIVTLGTPHHGTVLRHINELLAFTPALNVTTAILGLDAAWFLLTGTDGAKDLDWDNFDGVIPSCRLSPCNPFLKSLNAVDSNYNRYVAFGGADTGFKALILGSVLLSAGIPTVNDEIVPAVSAFYKSYASSSYVDAPLRSWGAFDLSHTDLHESNTYPDVRAALLGLLSAPPPPPPSTSVDVTGTWQGTYTDNFEPTPQSTTLNLTQTGTNVTGTWTSQFASNGGGTISGTFTGSLNGNIMTFTMAFTQTSQGPCPGSFSGTATVSGNSTTATYSGSDCQGLHSNGQVSVTKQAAPPPSSGVPLYTVTHFSAGISANAQLRGITKGPDSNLWFTETFGDRIGRITPAGAVTEFNLNNVHPTHITSGPDGNLWFTAPNSDGTYGRIGRITPAGVITMFSTGITFGVGFGHITTGPDGNLWFPILKYLGGIVSTGAIGRITTSGVVTEFSVGNGTAPSLGITTGADGNLWFTDSRGAIGRITPEGAVTEFVVGGNPQDITAGPDGNLWFTVTASFGQTQRIGRITPTGEHVDFRDGITYPNLYGITLGPDGNLWFTESDFSSTRNSRIAQITPAGVVTEFSAGISAGADPNGITAGPDGNIWFTEFGLNRIGRITLK